MDIRLTKLTETVNGTEIQQLRTAFTNSGYEYSGCTRKRAHDILRTLNTQYAAQLAHTTKATIASGEGLILPSPFTRTKHALDRNKTVISTTSRTTASTTTSIAEESKL